jgi:hypothetical protein
MPGLQIRWSEAEAGKAYARPFMVTFSDDDGVIAGSIAVNGADLTYYRQFQTAVLALTGELFRDPRADVAADPQRAWLDRLAGLLPAAGGPRVIPMSDFDEHHGRVFRFNVDVDAPRAATVDAPVLLEYQEFQAMIAHQTGRLFRDAAVEAVADADARHATWTATLRECVQPPSEAEAISTAWPWR